VNGCVISALRLNPDTIRIKVHAGLGHPNYEMIESFEYYRTFRPFPDSLLLSPRPVRTFVRALAPDVLWSLVTGLAVGLVTQSDAAFAVTFVIVALSNSLRTRQSNVLSVGLPK
jgi:hypothetical protein